MENTGKMLSALLIGAAIGGIVGVLFAPDKGSETRKRLFRRAEELADEVEGKLKEGTTNVKENLKDKWKETLEA
ncbi:MAG TPA: YtxH domain-containing protein [Flavobacteriales bacterium]|nr:YtxH domain-containing protein [Flavobacteriales bacterium]